jgi:uncharacterized protein (TIGR02246 family)
MDIKKAIEDLDTAYNKAFNQGDAAGCAAVFTEDVITLAPGQPMTRGKKALEGILQSLIDKNSGGTHSNKLLESGVEGDLAYQVGTYALSGANPPEQGKFVNILRRQPDGTWKVSVAIFNLDKP